MSQKFSLFCYFFIFCAVSVRAYYIVEPISNRFEQSSRDLDLSFSTGNPVERIEPRYLIKPYVKKVFGYRNYENPNVELGIDRPNKYREIAEMPERQMEWAETYVFPERNRNLGKFNNAHKGEVILELRVIANNNDVD